jgi:voltage-gated potassium channel
MRNIREHLSLSVSDREALLARIERYSELPLLALAFLMIPLLVGPFLWDLSPSEETTFLALDSFIWAVYAVDLAVKVAVATDRVGYLKRHWLEVLVVVVPFFRPLRLLRLMLFGSRAFVGARRLVHVDFLLVYGIGLVMIASTVMVSVEAGHSTSSIRTFADALWWAVVTVTTVGYGDMVPLTAAGRAIAFVLMLGGIAFFSGMTANLASFLIRIQRPGSVSLDDLKAEIQSLRQEISSLTRAER